MEIKYLQVIVTVFIAVFGWVIGHWFNSRRDQVAKKRDVSTEHLITAYRILTNEVSHRELNPERQQKLENILSDIQLFGSLYQVNSARSLAEEVARGGEFQLDPLINSLRDDLRVQLGLTKVTGNIKWLRMNDRKPYNKSM